MESTQPTLFEDLAAILADSHLANAPLAWVPASELPSLERKLLAHPQDMTSTLAAHHGGPISLKIFRSEQRDDLYLREVTLHANGDTVEYGLIAIHLDALPTELLTEVLAGKSPLGAILNASKLPYHSEPQGFFSVPAAALESVLPSSSGGKIHYGRYNHLIRKDNSACLARILEILP